MGLGSVGHCGWAAVAEQGQKATGISTVSHSRSCHILPGKLAALQTPLRPATTVT
jgi:hypothetical protein